MWGGGGVRTKNFELGPGRTLHQSGCRYFFAKAPFLGGGGGNMVVKMHAAELGMTFTPLPHAIPLILLLEQQKDNSYDMEKE